MTDAEGNEIGKLFVGGLSQATNNGSLRTYFSRFGEVDDAVVMMDNKTGRSRGFGYVKYREHDSVALALEAKPHILDGKEVDAKQCNVNMKGRNRRSLKIFVGGIGLDQDTESIRNFFKQFGRVTDVNLMMDSNKQRHRGFAFVGFEDESVVKRLISLHYVTMSNKQVEIKAMEPPNFGRKVGQTNCVSTATTIGAAASGETVCRGAFDHTANANNILSTSLAGIATQHHAYLSTQNPNIQYAQPNLLGATRTTGPTGYGVSLMADSLFQPTAFLQPMSPAQHSVRALGEPVSNNGIINTQYTHGKQLPLVLSNNQIHQPNHNGVISFPPNASPLFTFPYHLGPPHYLQQTQTHSNGTLGQLLNGDKNGIAAWQSAPSTNPAHLSICSTHLPSPQGNYLSCAQYNHATNAHTGHANLGPSANPPQTTGIPQMGQPGTGPPTIPSYYTVCPQYTTAIQVQPEQTTTLPYSAFGSTNGSFAHSNPNALNSVNGNSSMISTAVADQNGAGDAVMLPLATASRSTSPIAEVHKTGDTGALTPKQGNPGSVMYPALLMTTSGNPGISNNSIMTQPPNPMNMGQALWAHSSSNLIYPSLSVGWNMHAGAQSASPAQWHPSIAMYSQVNPASTSATCATSNATTMNSATTSGVLGCTTTTQMPSDRQPLVIRDAALSKKASPVTLTKASGDSLDGLISNAEHCGGFPSSSDYHLPDTGNNDQVYCHSKNSSDAQVEPGLGENQLQDVSTWQRNSTVLPPWSISAGSSVAPPSCGDMQNNNPGYAVPANLLMHPHAWGLPYELMDEAVPAYEMSGQGTGQDNASAHTQRGITNLKMAMHPLAPNPACSHASMNIGVCKMSAAAAGDLGKSEIFPRTLPSMNCSRLPQRLPFPQQNQVNIQPGHSPQTGSTPTTAPQSAQPSQQSVVQQQPCQPQSLSQQTVSSNTQSPIDDLSDSQSTLASASSSSVATPGASRTQVLSVDLQNQRTNPNPRVEYPSWLYNNTTGRNGHVDHSGTTGSSTTKELKTSTSSNVELECQGPAGAAGDYHHPVHTTHFASYHL